MFVSIDMDALRFLHKHVDHETVSALSWLECGQHTSIRIEPYHDRNMFLRGVSDLDVRMLYKNATGKPLSPESPNDALRYQLADVVQLLPSTRALTVEVLAQAELVDDQLHHGARFKYALGSKYPAEPVELFPLTTRPLTDKELAAAANAAETPVTGYPPRLTGQPRKPWEPDLPVHAPIAQERQTAAPAVPAAPEAPTMAKARTGSVRPIVFAAANKVLDDKGIEYVRAAWLSGLRNELVGQLTGEGYHQTTVRIKLSEWAKEKGI